MRIVLQTQHGMVMNLQIKENESLKFHSTWRIGGMADFFCAPGSVTELREALRWAESRALPVHLIGGGSNTLFADRGVRGLVIKLGAGFGRMQLDAPFLRVEAGAYAPCVARRAALAGLRGLEHLAGVPGTFGGLVVMNGGSLRRSLSENLAEVQALERNTGELRTFAVEECGFNYRRSMFQDGCWIIVGALLRLTPDDPRVIHREMFEIMRERRAKFPLRQPNCGSVFKNDTEIYNRFGPPGKIVEELGFKGKRFGNVQVSEQHANFIVNLGGAAAAEVIALTDRIKQAFHERTGCTLIEEYRRLGDF